jgi:hypothetical protein
MENTVWLAVAADMLSRTISAAALTHLAAKTSHLKGKRPLVIDGGGQKSVNAYDSADGRGKTGKRLCHPPPAY